MRIFVSFSIVYDDQKTLDNLVLDENDFHCKGCPFPGEPKGESSLLALQGAINTVWADIHGCSHCSSTVLFWKVLKE